MKFAIAPDNTITAWGASEQIPEGQEQQFASEKQLATLAAGWPTGRLVEIWNSFAGVAGIGSDLKPVSKFMDRQTGVKRIWKAIQPLAEDVMRARIRDAEAKLKAAQATAEPAPRTRKRAAKKDASPAQEAPTRRPSKAATTKDDAASAPATREGSKKALVLAMLQRPEGATLPEIMKTMGWQAHTVRGFMAGAMKKAGYAVISSKPEGGERTYQIDASEDHHDRRL